MSITDDDDDDVITLSESNYDVECLPKEGGLPGQPPYEPIILPLCEHIKPGGQRCGSPAYNGTTLCYHHTDVRRRVPKVNLFVRLWNLHPERDNNFPYDLPYLEDPEAIQIGFQQLIHGVSQELISPVRAKLILSALHGASLNLRVMEKRREQCERELEPRKGSAGLQARGATPDQNGETASGDRVSPEAVKARKGKKSVVTRR